MKMGISSWMRYRMEKRVQNKLGLSEEQTAQLMPILGTMHRPRVFSSHADETQLAQILRSEPLDAEQLNVLVSEKLKGYKQTLDEQAMALVAFVSELDLTQREKLQQLISSRHRCSRRMCRS